MSVRWFGLVLPSIVSDGVDAPPAHVDRLASALEDRRGAGQRDGAHRVGGDDEEGELPGFLS